MKQSLLNKVNYTLYFIFKNFSSEDFRQLRKLRIADSQTTIKTIIEDNCSIARFGDGELRLLSGLDTDFQNANPLIVSKLQEIISQPTEGLLIGLPHVWKKLWPLKYRALEYWGTYLNHHLKDRILPYVNFSMQYYDASFTRFYIDYRTNKNARCLVPLIKNIWDDRDICFIEGEYSRLGIGNDFFDNAKSIHRILCPATNAFCFYGQILKEANKLPKGTLFLIALGMTATCMAYDLHNNGFQAIDIGHVDVEYEWYKMGAKDKVSLKYKYVAESKHAMPKELINDPLYNSQIIARIGI